MLKELSILFTCGVMGGLANSFAVWVSGKSGINEKLGLSIAPEWTPSWLYQRLVWGGLWGLVFIVNSPLPLWMEGILYSLLPTAVVLFYVFPKQLNRGMMGKDLGALTPVFALVVNAIWGLTTVFWLAVI